MSPEKTVAPYGFWESPIKADFFVEGGVDFSAIAVNQRNGKIYLHETRPDGRAVIVEVTENGSKDVLPEPYSALTHVHEYGGATFCIRDVDDHLIFSDDSSKGVFDLDPSTGKVVPIVKEDPEYYYADFNIHPTNPNLVVAIREDHHGAKIDDVKNTLVVIDSTTKKVDIIAEGADFYEYPRFSPDGSKISWMQWYHPNMPWDHTELLVGDWKDGKVVNTTHIVMEADKQSITQPMWSPDGSLFFISDRSGFWQLYHWISGKVEYIHLKGLEDAEFGFIEWFLGSSSWTPLTADTIVAYPNRDAFSFGISIRVTTGEWRYIDPMIAEVANQSSICRVSDTSFVVIATGDNTPKALYLVDINSSNKFKTLKVSSKLDFSRDNFSLAEPISFPRKYGPGGGEAKALYLPPTNPDYLGPEDEKPPLIVAMHGGPTWVKLGSLSMRDQYWTSRGYALVEVNYVGSSGFGKKYRSLLKQQWGISDIADAASVVDYLVEQGRVDENRIGITGHSAGGYATLAAICSPWKGRFKAAVGESGISDMKIMVEETHKFESRYLNGLCFSPDATEDERERILKERSPIFHIDQIKAPLLMTSGREDKIVPPNQAQMMAEQIRSNGGAVKVLTYDGEGHILINGENIKDSILETEKWWKKYLLK